MESVLLEMDVDESFKTESSAIFKCYICTTDFKSKDVYMKHKKQKHSGSVQPCQKFKAGTCPIKNDECWYEHQGEGVIPPPASSPLKKDQVFWDTPRNNCPPQ